jgi:hypothetical protein
MKRLAFLVIITLLSGCAFFYYYEKREGALPTERECAIVIYHEYFDCCPATVEYLLGLGYTYPETFVLLYIAYHAHLDVRIVVRKYIESGSFFAVAMSLNLSPEIFFVPVAETVVILGPPYGRAYGFYRKRMKGYILTNRECIDLVLLRIMVEYYGYKPGVVIRWREMGMKGMELLIKHHSRMGKGKNIAGRKIIGVKRPWLRRRAPRRGPILPRPPRSTLERKKEGIKRPPREIRPEKEKERIKRPAKGPSVPSKKGKDRMKRPPKRPPKEIRPKKEKKHIKRPAKGPSTHPKKGKDRMKRPVKRPPKEIRPKKEKKHIKRPAKGPSTHPGKERHGKKAH